MILKHNIHSTCNALSHYYIKCQFSHRDSKTTRAYIIIHRYTYIMLLDESYIITDSYNGYCKVSIETIRYTDNRINDGGGTIYYE